MIMRDIAEKLGISVMTVSRVLSNKGNVNPEIKQKVLDTVKELNYHPHQIGRSLSSQKSYVIGVLSAIHKGPLHENPYYSELLFGIEEACLPYSYNLLISTQKMNTPESDYLKMYYEHIVDGLILIAPEMSHPQIQTISAENIPCVIISERSGQEKISYVDTDNRGGIRLAVEYLLKNGHTHIAFLKGIKTARNAKDRYTGFLEALKEHNIPVNKDWVLDGDFNFDSGREALNDILQLKPMPTALICANDLMALGVLAEASSRKFSIPENLSVIGFDGTPLINYTHPRLTTLKQPLKEMGIAAADMLINIIKNPVNPLETKLFSVTLQEGETVRNINKNN